MPPRTGSIAPGPRTMTRTLPLCVDLDGTLIRTDLLLESCLALIRLNPLYIVLLPFWLWAGKPALKANIARRVTIDAASLPYNTAFLEWLKAQKAGGRPVWLCTGSNEMLAGQVAGHVGIFDGIMASDSTINLAGAVKAGQLVERFGEKGFDYCGNHRDDLPIWKLARAAVIVNGERVLEREVGARASVERVFKSPRNGWRAFLAAIRPHQWVKNALLFVPLITAHRLGEPAMLKSSLLAFVAFCLCASSVYLLNDMLDLDADRIHPRKSRRPFASGDLSLLAGFVSVPGLLLASAWVALFLPAQFALALLTYYAVTLAYSYALKRLVLIDVLVLAGLYTLRVAAGAAAIAVPLSFWLLLFSIFLVQSLAMVKRYSELEAMRKEGRLHAAGRDYNVQDLPIIRDLGGAAGYVAVLILALYINSPAVELLYRRPEALWLLCGLMLYWISRVWLKVYRGEMHEDPVVFALRDPASAAIGALAVLTVWAAV